MEQHDWVRWVFSGIGVRFCLQSFDSASGFGHDCGENARQNAQRTERGSTRLIFLTTQWLRVSWHHESIRSLTDIPYFPYAADTDFERTLDSMERARHLLSPPSMPQAAERLNATPDAGSPAWTGRRPVPTWREWAVSCFLPVAAGCQESLTGQPARVF